VKCAQPDLETQALAEMREYVDKGDELHSLLSSADTDRNGKLSVEEFRQKLSQPKVLAQLAAFGLNVKDAQMFFELLLAESSEQDGLPLDHFVDGCLRMRGSATSIDLQLLHFRVAVMAKDNFEFNTSCLRQLEQIVNSVPFHRQEISYDTSSTLQLHKEVDKPIASL